MGISVKGGGSIGRAAVSKTAGCRFESCPPCECRQVDIHNNRKATTVSENHTADAASHESRGERKKNVFGRVAQFLREVVLELRKVVTPTRKELINFTSVVLAFVVIMMALITGLDLLIGFVTGFVFGDGTWTWGN